MITTKIYSSLVSIKPDFSGSVDLKEYSLCKNEAFSFQLGYKITDESAKSTPFFVKVISDLPISAYHIGCVPVIHADYSDISPKQPIGLYPDILIPKKVNAEIFTRVVNKRTRYHEKDEELMLFAYNDSWQGLWFQVNEEQKELKAGKYKVRIELYGHLTNTLIGESELSLEVLNQNLPEQSTYFTNWVHYDCLSTFYNVEIFSDRFYEILSDFLKKAVTNGMNMILLPAFTPPLDTYMGAERMTAQLVEIKKDGQKYTFDFSKVKYFIDFCRKIGIENFEHSHLFTQWGAEHAPKIVAEESGKIKKIFGWETDSAGEEYITFLRAYLTELRKFLKEEGLEKKILFHISDEPTEENFEGYKRVYDKISDLLEGYMVGDALSDVKFYESGLVQIPIARTKTADGFIGKGDNMWCYYTGMEIHQGMSNRIIQLPRERNRNLGITMYYHNFKGFLHWAYNYYYADMSTGSFNPFMNPCGGFPNAGTSYFVYPANDGTALQSVRQKNFAEGLTDIRALQLLESLSSRKECLELIEKYFGVPGFYKSPNTPQTLMEFRKKVNEKIKFYSK